MIQDVFLKLTLPNWLFLIFALVLATLASLYYLRTLPPLSAHRKWFLTILRAFALTIVLLLLLQPILQFVFQKHEKPVVALLVDNSASMQISERYGIRRDSLNFILNHLNRLNRGDSLEIQAFLFSNTLKRWKGDSLAFSEDGTNISQAIAGVLDSLSVENLQAIVLLSDGVYNQGPNPILQARRAPIPISTVVIGDSTPPKDIMIKRVEASSVTYVGTELPVEIVLQQSGFDGKKVALSIREGKQPQSRKVITLGRSGFEQKEILKLKPTKAGDFNYSVQVQGISGEVTARNNRKTITVRVLKRKLQVLIFSGVPNFDRHFLSFLDLQLPDMEFTFLTEKSRGAYFETEFQSVKLDSHDVVIFHGFPTPKTSVNHLSQIMDQIRKQKIPILWLFTRTIYLPKLRDFENLLPFRANSVVKPIPHTFVSLTKTGRLHPVIRIDKNEASNDLLWKELPPLEGYQGLRWKKNIQILLISSIQFAQNLPEKSSTRFPILVSYRFQEIKQLVFVGSNLGFWHFQLQEDPLREHFLQDFLERAIRWLVNRDDINQVQIQPLQSMYNVGETVIFSGQVYDEFYRPISDARVVVTLKKDTLEIIDEMFPEGRGYFRQKFSGLAEGEYQYRVVAFRNNQEVGKRSGKFSIMPFYLEFQQIPANITLLQEIARSSNGKIYRPATFLREFPQERLETRRQFSFSEYHLWQYLHGLMLIIILLGVEWFFRKRWGLL